MATLIVVPTGEEIYLDPDETILGGLYKAGYAYTIGCRRGGCGICKVDLLDGDVEYNRPVADTVLTDQERSEGTCLTCRAVPTCDVQVRMRGEDIRLINPFLASINATARARAGATARTRTSDRTKE